MNRNRRWIVVSIAIFSAGAGGILGYNLGHTAGYDAHEYLNNKKINDAITAFNGEKLLPIVRCARDLPEGTILNMEDMVEEQVRAATYPSDPIESRFIGFGRKLQYAKVKGETLALSDFGFKY